MSNIDNLVLSIESALFKINIHNKSLYSKYLNEFNNISQLSIEQYLNDLQRFESKILNVLNGLERNC